MKLVDVHCHLESDEFADSLDLLLDRAERAGVVKLITCSIEPGQWPFSRELASKYAVVEFAWGIHPWYIRKEDFGRIEDSANRGCGAVAIGEIARPQDRKIRHSRRSSPSKHRCGSRATPLPVIIHCRGALNELARPRRKPEFPRRAAGALFAGRWR